MAVSVTSAQVKTIGKFITALLLAGVHLAHSKLDTEDED